MCRSPQTAKVLAGTDNLLKGTDPTGTYLSPANLNDSEILKFLNSFLK